MTVPRITRFLLLLLSITLLPAGALWAQPMQKRIGLVIGNGDYKAGRLPTAANDAGLLAQTLQAAGFDVIGARDLDGDAMRQTFRDFVEKVSAAGPDTVVFVYLSGYGLQLEGDNYFVPVDARIGKDLDVPIQALRLNDYVRPLGALGAKAVVVVLDTARDSPFAKSGQPLAGGMALVEPTPGVMIAFNAAPGTIAPGSEPPYGVYAQALAEMIREGGLPLVTVFDRVRLRVNDLTGGSVIPWHASKVETSFEFFERAPDAPALEASHQISSARGDRAIRDFSAEDAYHAALERDTLRGYLEFLDVYPEHPLARRVRGIVAARREAITWRRSREADTPEAYWSYLDRYPNGPHSYDARRRLSYLTAPPLPPPTYAAFDYGLPPPPRDEIVFIERRVVFFGDPFFRFAPPPPSPVFFLPPPPPPFFFPPPPPPVGLFILPAPAFVVIPLYVRSPAYVAPPPNNVVFNNIHNTTVINNFAAPGVAPAAAPAAGAIVPAASPVAPVVGAPGAPGASTPTRIGAAGVVAATAAAAGVAAAVVALPPSLAKRAAAQPVSTSPGATPQPGGATNASTSGPPTGQQPVGTRTLPGSPQGAALPSQSGPPSATQPAAGTSPPPSAQPRLLNAQPSTTALPSTGQASTFLPNRPATPQGSALPDPTGTSNPPPAAQPRLPNASPPATAPPSRGQVQGSRGTARTQDLNAGPGQPTAISPRTPSLSRAATPRDTSSVPPQPPRQEQRPTPAAQQAMPGINRPAPGKAPPPAAKDAKKCGVQGTPPCN